MKKILFAVIPVFILFILLCIFAWPRPFLPLASSENIEIVSFSDSGTQLQGHWINTGSPEYMRLQHVLKGYSYHCILSTFITPGSEHCGSGLQLQIRSGNNSIVIGDTGKITVNGRPYAVGFFGSLKARRLVSQVELIAENGITQPPCRYIPLKS